MDLILKVSPRAPRDEWHQFLRKLASHPHAIPRTNPPACAPLAMFPSNPNRQPKNQISAVITVCLCR
jgi:hypothetical protein